MFYSSSSAATGSSSSSTPKTTKGELNNSVRHAKEGLGAGGAEELRSNRRLLVLMAPVLCLFFERATEGHSKSKKAHDHKDTSGAR